MVAMLAICLSLFASRSFAQEVDYSKQVNALKQSFDEKKADAISPFVSKELSFAAYPAGATTQILGQVFASLPKLNALEILSQKKGEASLRYNFTALGKRESKILFNADGHITKLELIDNLLKEQAEAQKAAAAQVQAPQPGALGVKYPFARVELEAGDGQIVVGNLFEIGKDKPVILLCHQAGYNKHEYADIAPKLNAMGYNVLAIDQRSGGVFDGMNNETADLAKVAGLNPQMVDAQSDLEAGVEFLAKRYGRKVTLWGSSYSSSLALFVGASNEHVNAVISFSPGDYFGEAKESLAKVFEQLKKPFMVTSSKQESEALSSLLSGVKLKKNQSQFIPEGTGYHGSRALWEGQKGGEEYWSALTAFLSKLYER